METFLRKVYYDPAHVAGFASVKKLVDAAKAKGYKDATQGTVKKWLLKQETYALSRPSRRRFKRSQVVVEGLDAQWEMDLIDFSKLSPDNTDKYVLVMEDVFSRYAWTSVLKTKTAAEVSRAMRHIFEQGRRPRYSIRSDQGKEFTGFVVKKLLREYDINHIVTYNEVKAGYIERLIKTIRSKMYRYMLHKQSHKWSHTVQSITTSYNNSVHRSLGIAPKDVVKENESEIRFQQYLIKNRIATHTKKDIAVKREKKEEVIKSVLKPKLKRPKYKVGNVVRISRLRTTFSREYDVKWTGELFRIRKVYMREDRPIYQLDDWSGEEIAGTFYEEELAPGEEPDGGVYKIEKVLKRRKRRGENEALVQWFQWPAKYNSWVSMSTIQDLKKT
jgi:hypothetical protein